MVVRNLYMTNFVIFWTFVSSIIIITHFESEFVTSYLH